MNELWLVQESVMTEMKLKHSRIHMIDNSSLEIHEDLQSDISHLHKHQIQVSRRSITLFNIAVWVLLQVTLHDALLCSQNVRFVMKFFI